MAGHSAPSGVTQASSKPAPIKAASSPARWAAGKAGAKSTSCHSGAPGRAALRDPAARHGGASGGVKLRAVQALGFGIQLRCFGLQQAVLRVQRRLRLRLCHLLGGPALGALQCGACRVFTFRPRCPRRQCLQQAVGSGHLQHLQALQMGGPGLLVSLGLVFDVFLG